MSVGVVVTKIMTFSTKCVHRPSQAGLCVTVNSSGLGSVALAGKRLVVSYLCSTKVICRLCIYYIVYHPAGWDGKPQRPAPYYSPSVGSFKHNLKNILFCCCLLTFNYFLVPPVTTGSSDSVNWQTLCALQIVWIVLCFSLNCVPVDHNPQLLRPQPAHTSCRRRMLCSRSTRCDAVCETGCATDGQTDRQLSELTYIVIIIS